MLGASALSSNWRSVSDAISSRVRTRSRPLAILAMPAPMLGATEQWSKLYRTAFGTSAAARRGSPNAQLRALDSDRDCARVSTVGGRDGQHRRRRARTAIDVVCGIAHVAGATRAVRR